MSKTNGYALARMWFDFAFTNPECVNPNHSALYFWLIEKMNRCGWSDKLSITSSESMAACGFKTYPPYKKSFDFLVQNGFIEIITPSHNQYTANIICLKLALSKNDKANTKPPLKQTPNHVESKHESTFDINKTLSNLETKELSKHYVHKLRVGVSFVDFTPFNFLKKEAPISLDQFKVVFSKIDFQTFETEFNNEYQARGFNNKDHAVNAANQLLKQLSNGKNKSATQPNNIHSGGRKNFTAGA